MSHRSLKRSTRRALGGMWVWTSLGLTAVASVAEAAGVVHATPFDHGLPTEGQWRNGFAFADMNEDGNPDLVHGPPRKGPQRPVVFLGNGDGDWAPWNTSFPDLTYAYGDTVVADFDGDGHNDIALAMHMQGIVVLHGDGAGTFRSASRGLPRREGDKPQAFTSRAIEATDWNDDGRPDLIALWEGFSLLQRRNATPSTRPPKVQVFLNNGDGSWTTSEPCDSVLTGFGDGLAVGSLNGDDHPDFVTTSQEMGVRALGGIGVLDGGSHALEYPALPERTYITAVCIADNDAVIARKTFANNGFQVAIERLHITGDTSFASKASWIQNDDTAITALAAGDVDGDGCDEVVAGRDDGSIVCFQCPTSDAFVERLLQPALRGNGRCYAVALHDVDKDGRPELAADFAQEPNSLASFPDRTRSTGSMRIWKLQFEPSDDAMPSTVAASRAQSTTLIRSEDIP